MLFTGVALVDDAEAQRSAAPLEECSGRVQTYTDASLPTAGAILVS